MSLARRFRRTPSSGLGVIMATLSVALCTAAVVERRNAGPSLGELLAGPTRADATAGTGASSQVSLRAFVVLQPGDCDGRLAIANTIGTVAPAGVIGVWGVVVGAGQGLDSLQRRLADDGVVLTLLAAPRHLAGALHALGHTTTPLIVVVDGSDRVMYAAPLPRDDTERSRLLALMPLLAAPRQSP